MNLLKKLLTIPSQSGSEAAIIDYISDLLKKHNIKTYRQAENVVAFIPGSNRSKAILFNGHVDTVSEGDASAWEKGPFSGAIENGRMYGLGASDMKAGVAALIDIALYFQKTKPSCDVWFSFVVGEEVDGRGTKSFLDWFFTERHDTKYENIEAIIAEPTNDEFIGIGHRGNAFVELTTVGGAGHASAKHMLSVQAIPIAAEIVKRVASLEHRWQKRYSHKRLGLPTIGVTSAQAGDMTVSNQIPSTCTITLDIRTTPLLHEKLNSLMNEFTSKLPYDAYFNFIGTSPAGWCSENSLLRTIFSDTWPSVLHQTMNGSADQCFYSQKGIPAVIFGPGQRDRMHSTDEYFKLSVMRPYKNRIKQLVKIYGQEN